MHSTDYCTIDNIADDLAGALLDCDEIYSRPLREKCERAVKQCVETLDRILKGMGEDR